MRCFHYKVLNNALFLNKQLFLFKNSNSPLCYFCKDVDETVIHLCFYCPNARNRWNQLNVYLAEDLPILAEFWIFQGRQYRKRNALSPFSIKLCVYRFREKIFLNVMILVNQMARIKKIEKENSLYSEECATNINIIACYNKK